MLTDWQTDRQTDWQTHRKDKNYIPPLHTSYAGGIKMILIISMTHGGTFYTFSKIIRYPLHTLQALLDFSDCASFLFRKLLQSYKFWFVCICIWQASVTVFVFFGPFTVKTLVKVLWSRSVNLIGLILGRLKRLTSTCAHTFASNWKLPFSNHKMGRIVVEFISWSISMKVTRLRWSQTRTPWDALLTAMEPGPRWLT